MLIPEKTDLHIHTTVSDGTDRPQEIVGLVSGAGIGLFSVTDHDSVKASVIIRGLLKKGDPAFLTGAEFSCRDDGGKYHILGYGYDPDAEAMRAFAGKAHGMRMRKVEKRLNALEAEFGISFPREEVDRLLKMDNPGKPHIGNLMVKYGFANSQEEVLLKSKVGIDNEQGQLLVVAIDFKVGRTLVSTSFLNHLIPMTTYDER